MAKTRISEFDANSANNTDIDGINLAEGMAPGLVNNAIRELMAQLKDFQVGSAGDNVTVGGNLSVTGTTAFAGAVTLAGRAVDAFPSGTKMTFQQTAAPTGWTKDTTHDNKALRVVSGTAGSGGSVNFTAAFGSQNVGATTLDGTQIPGHTHTFSGTQNTESAGGHAHTGSATGVSLIGDFWVGGPNNGVGGIASQIGTGGRPGLDFNSGAQVLYRIDASHGHTLSINSAGAHTHTVSVSGTTASTGGNASHTHSLDLAVSYVDLIICTKT
jgi:hypothetical protein